MLTASLHPYRRAAIRAAIFTIAASAMFILPTKLLHNDGSAPLGYFTSLGHVLLLPGSIVSLFVYYPTEVSTASFVLWLIIVVLVSWLFYFGLLSIFVRIRAGSAR
jgi:hypothetical protein